MRLWQFGRLLALENAKYFKPSRHTARHSSSIVELVLSTKIGTKTKTENEKCWRMAESTTKSNLFFSLNPQTVGRMNMCIIILKRSGFNES